MEEEEKNEEGSTWGRARRGGREGGYRQGEDIDEEEEEEEEEMEMEEEWTRELRGRGVGE